MSNKLIGLIAGGLLAALAGAGPAHAQLRGNVPARIAGIQGRTYVQVGEDENFRVQLVEGATWPIEYLWEFGDGSQSGGRAQAEGNNVVHRFSRPGRYEVTVTVRNQWGQDEGRLVVNVAPAPVRVAADSVERRGAGAAAKQPAERPRPAPASSGGESLRSALRVVPEQGGYTWIVATYLARPHAESHEYQLRQEGYRTTVIVDDNGPGSVAYRVAVGQFTSERAALSARRRLPVEKGWGVWLLPLSEAN